MPIRPSELDPVDADSQPKSVQSTQESTHHGLTHIPAESLNHITSFLDPPSLLVLATVSRYLHEHVQNDTTWQNAFFCQLLGIAPESRLSQTSTLLLRRTESSWRDEYIARYILKRRWERSPTTTITHTPHDSLVAGMHLMADTGLLASSLQYGIISRSLPLTGKVLRGFLDASGTGLGVGNPNQEFTPNISACALASDGGTALVLWGFRTGEVSVVTATRAMERRGRATVFAHQCIVEEKHDAAVLDAIWGRNCRQKGAKSMYAILTAGADGRVKLWNSNSVKCLWSSQVAPSVSIPDPCVKVAAELERGIAVGAMKSGTIIVWLGLNAYLTYRPPNTGPPSPVGEIHIQRPFTVPDDETSPDKPIHTPVAIFVDCTTSAYRILVAYENHPFFYRLHVDAVSHDVDICAFGNAALTSVTVVLPCFADRPGDLSFVFAGDLLGCVSVYDWGASPPIGGIQEAGVAPVRTFAAYTDGAGVSALAWNGAALATGSTRGVVCVWDALMLSPLLVFPVPGLGPRVRARAREGENAGTAGVSQILLVPGSDMLVAAIGSRVMTWKVGKPWRGKGKNATRTKLRKWERTSAAKYQQQKELHEAISQSRLELEEDEQMQPRRSHGSEVEQLERLAALGLDEVEAVEYVLMVSRDEEMMRRAAMASSTDEGTFSVDSDVVLQSTDVEGSSDVQPVSHSRRSSSGSPSNNYVVDYSVRRGSGSTLNQKVQVSPRWRPEPMEAGLLSSTFTLGGASPVRTDDESHFPAMAVHTKMENNGGIKRKCDGKTGDVIDGRKSTSHGSIRCQQPVSKNALPVESAWNTPLRTSSGALTGSGTPSGSGVHLSATSVVDDSDHGFGDIGEAKRSFDEEMSMAIELSLMDLRRRGD